MGVNIDEYNEKISIKSIKDISHYNKPVPSQPIHHTLQEESASGHRSSAIQYFADV